MNLIKFGSCWINPKHIDCAKIEETFSEYSHKQIYYVVIICCGHEIARMQYDHREDAELILNEIVVKAMEESDNNGNAQG